MAKTIPLQTAANKKSLDGCVKYIKYEKVPIKAPIKYEKYGIINPGLPINTPKVTLELCPEYKDKFYDALTKGELPFITSLLANCNDTIAARSNKFELKVSQGPGDRGVYIYVSSNPHLQHLPFFESENLAFAFISPADKEAFIKLTCLKDKDMYLSNFGSSQGNLLHLARTCIDPRTESETSLLLLEEDLYFKQVKELAEQQVSVRDSRIIDKLHDISVIIKMANIINSTEEYKALLSNSNFIANLEKELEGVSKLGYLDFKYTIDQDKILIQPFTLVYKTKEGDVGFEFVSNEKAAIVYNTLRALSEFDEMASKIEIKGNKIIIKKSEGNFENGVFDGTGALGIATPSEDFRGAFEKAFPLTVAFSKDFNAITDIFHYKKLESFYFCSQLSDKGHIVFGDYYQVLTEQQQPFSQEILELIGENIEYNDNF